MLSWPQNHQYLQAVHRNQGQAQKGTSTNPIQAIKDRIPRLLLKDWMLDFGLYCLVVILNNRLLASPNLNTSQLCIAPLLVTNLGFRSIMSPRPSGPPLPTYIAKSELPDKIASILPSIARFAIAGSAISESLS